MLRIHAFEWNDNPRAPRWLRDSIVEILGRGLRWGKIYVPVAPLFARFLERAGASSVLDLASGSGEPCRILLDALEEAGEKPPRFVLSDLFPNEPALRSVAERYPGRVEVVTESVDATAVPERFDQPARTIITAFHHFTPELAARIFADGVAKKRAIFILEPGGRRLRLVLSVLPAMILGTLANPFVAERDRIVKFIFTFLLPVIPLAGFWDACVSTLRVYTEPELRAMVEPLGGGYTWEYHVVPFTPFGRATIFLGLPPVALPLHAAPA